MHCVFHLKIPDKYGFSFDPIWTNAFVTLLINSACWRKDANLSIKVVVPFCLIRVVEKDKFNSHWTLWEGCRFIPVPHSWMLGKMVLSFQDCCEKEEHLLNAAAPVFINVNFRTSPESLKLSFSLFFLDQCFLILLALFLKWVWNCVGWIYWNATML